jgi:hypothetical protein
MDKSKNPYEVEIGQIWVEVDRRFDNEWLFKLRKEIIGFSEDGTKAEMRQVETGRISFAKLTRFHGRNIGYKLLKEHK